MVRLGQKNVRQMIGGTSLAWNGFKDVIGDPKLRTAATVRFDG